MEHARTIKIVVIVLAVIIVILLGVLTVTPSTKELTTNDISVALPAINATVTSPVAIEGTVTGGGWFFEGSFPIEIMDGSGAVIGEGAAQALGDWMSTGTVPFSASIPFTMPHSATGAIIFLKDNPSGAPENAGSSTILIRFGN